MLLCIRSPESTLVRWVERALYAKCRSNWILNAILSFVMQTQLMKALSLSVCVDIYQPWSRLSLVEVAAQCLKTNPLKSQSTLSLYLPLFTGSVISTMCSPFPFIQQRETPQRPACLWLWQESISLHVSMRLCCSEIRRSTLRPFWSLLHTFITSLNICTHNIRAEPTGKYPLTGSSSSLCVSSVWYAAAPL